MVGDKISLGKAVQNKWPKYYVMLNSLLRTSFHLTVLPPVGQSLFITATCLLKHHGSPQKTFEEYKLRISNCWGYSIIYWFSPLLFMYTGRIPLKFSGIYFDVVGFVWSIILSSLLHT